MISGAGGAANRRTPQRQGSSSSSSFVEVPTPTGSQPTTPEDQPTPRVRRIACKFVKSFLTKLWPMRCSIDIWQRTSFEKSMFVFHPLNLNPSVQWWSRSRHSPPLLLSFKGHQEKENTTSSDFPIVLLKNNLETPTVPMLADNDICWSGIYNQLRFHSFVQGAWLLSCMHVRVMDNHVSWVGFFCKEHPCWYQDK